MSQIKVALLQMLGCGKDQTANLAKAETFCRQAAERGADVALLPELWNIAYSDPDPDDVDGRQWKALAVPENGPYVQRFQRLASELDLAIATTYLAAHPEGPRNCVSLIDHLGQIVQTYAKVHTCAFLAKEAFCKGGEEFFVSRLRTRVGELNVGMMICFDREFPESARILMLKGAELILTPNACCLDQRRIEQFRTRAFENAVAMAMTNYASPDYNGRSLVVGADGRSILEAGEEEGIFIAELDLEQLRAHRQQTIWGNAFRRPKCYGSLMEEEKAELFERTDVFGRPFQPRVGCPDP